MTPVVTHFGSFNVTRGTLSENTYHLSVVNYVNTAVSSRSDGSQTLFESVSRSVGFSVQSDRATTNTEDTTVKWTFNEPGYYALYKGTKRVTGTFRESVCVFGFGSPQYLYQGRGTYTTYGHIEEGTVVCDDKLPAKTVRAAARVLLSCPSSAAEPKR